MVQTLTVNRYDDEERMVQRFLEGMQWKYKDAYEAIQIHHKFLTTTFPTELNAYKVYEE